MLTKSKKYSQIKQAINEGKIVHEKLKKVKTDHYKSRHKISNKLEKDYWDKYLEVNDKFLYYIGRIDNQDLSKAQRDYALQYLQARKFGERFLKTLKNKPVDMQLRDINDMLLACDDLVDEKNTVGANIYSRACKDVLNLKKSELRWIYDKKNN